MRTTQEMLNAVDDGSLRLSEVPQARLDDSAFRLAVGQVVVFSAPRSGLGWLEEHIGSQIAAQICPDDGKRRRRKTFDDNVEAKRLSTALIVPKTLGITAAPGPNLAVVLPGFLKLGAAEDGDIEVLRSDVSVLFSLLTNRTVRNSTMQARPTVRVDYRGGRSRLAQNFGVHNGWVGRQIRPSVGSVTEATANHDPKASVLELARRALILEAAKRPKE